MRLLLMAVGVCVLWAVSPPMGFVVVTILAFKGFAAEMRGHG
jgi:hypothetical protein